MLEEKVNAQLTDDGLLESDGGEVVTGREPVLATPALAAYAPGAATAVITAKVAGAGG